MRVLFAILFGVLIGLVFSKAYDRDVPLVYAETDSPVITEYDPTGQEMYWEKVENKYSIDRTWVPGGWLIYAKLGLVGLSVTFYSDPEHKWQPAVKEGAPWGK